MGMCFWIIQLFVLLYHQAYFFVSVYLYFRGLYLKPGGGLSLNLLIYLVITEGSPLPLCCALCGRNRETGQALRRWVRASRGDDRGR